MTQAMVNFRMDKELKERVEKQKSEMPLHSLRPETKGRIDEIKNLALFAKKLSALCV